jgi:DNA (cytosine-5)-methyltransferase 1
MKFISLFSGIGGFDLGLERAGMQCVAQVEIDDFCQKVLTKNFPNVPKFKDVRDVGKHNLPESDVVCAGFPCQPHSVAGKRLASADERDLWSETARVVGEINPKWFVGENVRGLLSSENGRFFGRILRDLVRIGYDIEWFVLSAEALGAPHKRERVFVVANNRQKRIQGRVTQKIQRLPVFSWCENVGRVENLRGRSDIPEPLFRGTVDGIPRWVDRLGSVGNAVMPQAAELVGNCIMEAS